MPALAAHVHSGGSQEARRAFCGAEETRTPDFLLAKEALYRLSYGPGSGCAASGAAASARASVSERASDAGWAPRGEAALSVAPGNVPSHDAWSAESGKREWALLDSNQRPLPYQGSALTS